MRFPLPLGTWDGLRYFSVALPKLFIYLFFMIFAIIAIWVFSSPEPKAHKVNLDDGSRAVVCVSTCLCIKHVSVC